MKTKKFLLNYALAIVASVGLYNVAQAQVHYNLLEDAAVAQAKEWQSGRKAKPLISSDGKVVFPYGQSMPKLTCSPLRACDVELEANEKVNDVILGDKVNWAWEPTKSTERGKVVRHVVFQPRDKDLESNAIITTDRRTYHIKLYSPPTEGVYLNRVGFYYPEDLVASWADKANEEAEQAQKEEGTRGMARAVPARDIDLDYRITGDADFKPTNVFNDGERTTILMPETIKNGEHPLFFQIDEKGNVMMLNYRRIVSETTGAIRYEVDKLFAKGELRRGSEVVKITWKKKEDKGFFGWSRF